MALAATRDNMPRGVKRIGPRAASFAGAALARFFLVWVCTAALGQAPEAVAVTPAALRDGLALDAGWRFHPGDVDGAADPALDDGAWTVLPAWPGSRANPAGPASAGYGWSRIRLAVDPALRGKTVGVDLNQWGGVEIFLNGRLWRRFGVPAADPANERAARALEPLVMTLGGEPVQTLAVRFSNHAPTAYLPHFGLQGCQIRLVDASRQMAIHHAQRSARERMAAQALLLAGLYGAFALIHLCLFLFDRSAPANFYFGATVLSAAVLAGLQRVYLLTVDFMTFFWAFKFSLCMEVAVIGFLVLFTHRLFFDRIPRITGWGVAILSAATVAWGFVYLFESMPVRLAYGLELGYAFAVTLWAMRLRRPGAKLLGFSMLALIALYVGAIFNPEVNRLVRWLGFEMSAAHVGGLMVVAAMSVFLSRRFARTNRRLAEQLAEVRKLSTELLDREREAKEREIRQRLLEADNQRKTKELEDARAFQLSMLPKKLPQPPGLRLAASMDTAAEVGGDYYDARLHADGGLTLALGDAAGHGAKAGVLVVAIKSLFPALAEEPSIPRIFEEMNRSLKPMRLRNMFMALTLAKIQGRRLTASAAGMPPMLLRRAASGAVEEIFIKGLPLAGVAGFPYRQTSFDMEPGDTLLMMSDGLPELFNPESEMFGIARCKTVFQREGGGAPAAMIAALRREAEAWRGVREQDDDMTFLVVKWLEA